MQLTQELYDNFLERLRYDCHGPGVDDHYTANALFIIQEKILITGIDLQYAEGKVLLVDDSEYFSIDEYYQSLDDDERELLDIQANALYNNSVLKLEEYQKWRLVDGMDNHTVTGYCELWNYLNCHFTKHAAKKYIAENGHKHKRELRIYVESQYRCDEFNMIKDAMILGYLKFDAPSIS